MEDFSKCGRKKRGERNGLDGAPRAFGDAGASRGRRAPKGLTRALKIENSKWPIFPADGTETKSRQPFIMTCIGVRAAVICTVSLQNVPRLIGSPLGKTACQLRPDPPATILSPFRSRRPPSNIFLFGHPCVKIHWKFDICTK